MFGLHWLCAHRQFRELSLDLCHSTPSHRLVFPVLCRRRLVPETATQALIAQCYQSERLLLTWADLTQLLGAASQEANFDEVSNTSDT